MTSRIFRIDSLSAGIGHLLVLIEGELYQLAIPASLALGLAQAKVPESRGMGCRLPVESGAGMVWNTQTMSFWPKRTQFLHQPLCFLPLIFLVFTIAISGCTIAGLNIGGSIDRSISKDINKPYSENLSLGDKIRVQTFNEEVFVGRVEAIPDFSDSSDTLVLGSKRYMGFVTGTVTISDSIMVSDIASMNYACNACPFTTIGVIVGFATDLVVIGWIALLGLLGSGPGLS